MIAKKKLIKLLVEKGLYEDCDSTLVDELYWNLGSMRTAKAHVKEHGILGAGDKDGKIFHQSPALKIYNESLRNVMNISQKLGLSAYDRSKIDIEEERKDDGFNDKIEE